jgi:UDP-N-acetylmuramoyl-tripeptide--D-alanyl-D-alanine ligase
VVTFGFDEQNDVRASDYTLDWPHGSRFTLHARGETREVRTRLLGRHQVYPILAAVAVAIEDGCAPGPVLTRLEGLAPTPNRMELVPLENGAFLLRDEYKSAVETIETALETLAEIPARRIAVLGGITEPTGSPGPLYRGFGEQLGRFASRVVFYGSQRYFRNVASGVRRAGRPDGSSTFAGMDLMRAVEIVRAELQPGDVVLVKGRHRERLDRISLALTGRTVGCKLHWCDLNTQSCGTCPMLERGWYKPGQAGAESLPPWSHGLVPDRRESQRIGSDPA